MLSDENKNICSVRLIIPTINDDIHELLTSREQWSFYKKEIIRLLESAYVGEDNKKVLRHRLHIRNKIGDKIDKDKGEEARLTRLHKRRFVNFILDDPITISQQIKYS